MPPPSTGKKSGIITKALCRLENGTSRWLRDMFEEKAVNSRLLAQGGGRWSHVNNRFRGEDSRCKRSVPHEGQGGEEKPPTYTHSWLRQINAVNEKEGWRGTVGSTGKRAEKKKKEGRAIVHRKSESREKK